MSTSRSLGLVWTATLLAACAPGKEAGPPAVDREARVVANLLPAIEVSGAAPRHFTLVDRMMHYHTPGVTIAVADSGRIVWARGYGVKEAGTADSVLPTTIFEAGSISKPVAATAMLRLVEQGKLSLDQDVNGYLKSWKIPENKFTAREKVTLRRLVSHSAGLTVHGFPGYAVTDPIPTVPQILDGKKPANTAPVRVDTFPGAISRYSGGGITIEQLVLTDVTGKPFPALLEELVLGPIGMSSSTYEQPLPASMQARASAAHRASGAMIPGRYYVYPEMAAAGLWTTPTDLLKWAMEIAAARAGRSTKVLSQAMATQMLTVQKGDVGLGPFLGGSGRAFHFGHGGSDQGFQSDLVYFPETGKGAAVMVNGDGGSSMLTEIMYAIAAEYGWPDYSPKSITAIVMDTTALDRFVGVYQVASPFNAQVTLARRAGTLFIDVSVIGARIGPETEVVFTAPTKFTTLDGGYEVTAVTDKSGKVTALEMPGFKVTRTGK